MTAPPDGRRKGTTPTTTGRVVPCPDCDGATGVPLPAGSTVADGADPVDGSSPTLCPSCGLRFEVEYLLSGS
ncbi:hypothetical protein [Halosimplex halobium]|uniref:hypothetical protein n=1 Tax=Halosimplex halobium TaxID=3396618 RepID=UPI003F5478B7